MAAGIIAILIAWIVLSAYAWSWVAHRAVRSEAETFGDVPYLPEGLKAGGDSGRGSGMAADLHETQTQQANCPFALGMGSR